MMGSAMMPSAANMSATVPTGMMAGEIRDVMAV